MNSEWIEILTGRSREGLRSSLFWFGKNGKRDVLLLDLWPKGWSAGGFSVPQNYQVVTPTYDS